ncbi:MAG: alpha-amylase family glycosyl hydrolase, partial [Bacteroidales bacterium]|nr:alpha-amylase family glycosyl hydrolase [Bacteroidales bacterium]
SGIWLYYGDGSLAQFYKTGAKECTLSLEFESSWGVLVRTSTTQWDSYKYGASSGKNQLSYGTSLSLTNSNAQDILLPGMTTTMYHSHFWTDWFADLNYGPAATCEQSGAFKAVCESADKWITMGVDGFRLDAVKHIYHNANSDENPTFLKKFYDHCNATFKSVGGKGEFYMVGEQFSDAAEVAPYYKGIPAFFEFSFWWRLKDCINSGNGSSFVGTIQGYQKLYAGYRSDYIEATKLSNHDEDRAGNDLGKNVAKMKLAGAVLLTAGGQPYIYQGEELGYWGSKSGGDEYVRTPMMWNANGSSLADSKLGDKIDRTMLTSSISVESQAKDDNSILNVYRKFGVLRDEYKALAKGSFDYCPAAASVNSVSAWYRSYENQKVLVVHNFSGGNVTVNFTSDKLDNAIATNGTVKVNGTKVTLGAYSSVVFLQ